MAPTLYMVYPSVPSRSVLITAKAIGLELNLEIVNLIKRENFSPAFLKKNPQHSVPTLEEEDGFTCWDSHAIMVYLITKYAKDDSLYPKDPRKRVVVDQRLHFDSGVVLARLLEIVQPYLFSSIKAMEEDQSKTGVTHQIPDDDFSKTFAMLQPYLSRGIKTLKDQSKIDGIHQAYELLNTFLEANKWVAGDSKTIADYSLFTSISSINTLIPIDAKKYPRVVAWLKQVEALPEAKENVVGLEGFKQLFGGVRLP